MYSDSQAYSADSSPIFSSNSMPKGEEIAKNREIMDFDILRFRCAPSSLFSNISNGVDKNGDSDMGFLKSFEDLEDNNKDLGNGYSLNSQLPPYYPRKSSDSATQEATMDHEGKGKMGSNLMRQNSSPAGLFSHLTPQNVRGVGRCRVGNGANGDVSPSSIRLKGQMNFSSGVPSSLGKVSRISEMEGENVGASGPDDAKLRNGEGDTQYYTSEYSFGSWNDSMQFSENFTGMKRELDGDGKLFSRPQNEEIGNRIPILSHHLSLPKTSAEMAATEKLLPFQDSVPCKIRAKRGCATHPRSIAERVRRTRISERMRKLQELVPNMDKQTNTAYMLDLAVEYIKDLQKQVKALGANLANCRCSGREKLVPY